MLVLALAGCGGARVAGGPDPPGRGRVGRPLETYQQLGLLAGPAHFPAVASFGTIGGPADSTYILLGVSLPSSALRFQREPAGFTAAYRVAATFLQDSQVVKRIERSEVVRVPTFAETGRTDESILFQDAIILRLVTTGMPDALRSLPANELSLVLNDVRNLVANDVPAESVSEPVRAAAAAMSAAQARTQSRIDNARPVRSDTWIDTSDGDVGGAHTFRRGTRVRHPKFGIGLVRSVMPGMPVKAVVEFEAIGEKTVVVTYLEPVY